MNQAGLCAGWIPDHPVCTTYVSLIASLPQSDTTSSGKFVSELSLSCRNLITTHIIDFDLILEGVTMFPTSPFIRLSNKVAVT